MSVKDVASKIIEDLEALLRDGVEEALFDERAKELGFSMGPTLKRQLVKSPRVGTLRMSNIGTPCARKLYYSVNSPDDPLREELRPDTKLKFLYGDLTEEMILTLVSLSGHEVQHTQGRVSIEGIWGTFDAIIDGVLFDVKSASKYSFRKFKEGKLADDDPFGYIPQLMSYLYSLKDDDRLLYKEQAAFLVFDKEGGSFCADIHDKPHWFDQIPQLFQIRKDQTASPDVPQRKYEPVPDGKSGNMKLPMQCSYCEWKFKCHPDVRIFISSNGPVFLTTVQREPRMLEVDRNGVKINDVGVEDSIPL